MVANQVYDASKSIFMMVMLKSMKYLMKMVFLIMFRKYLGCHHISIRSGLKSMASVEIKFISHLKQCHIHDHIVSNCFLFVVFST